MQLYLQRLARDGELDGYLDTARSLQDYRDLVAAAIDAGRDNEGAIDEPLLMTVSDCAHAPMVGGVKPGSRVPL